MYDFEAPKHKQTQKHNYRPNYIKPAQSKAADHFNIESSSDALKPLQAKIDFSHVSKPVQRRASTYANYGAVPANRIANRTGSLPGRLKSGIENLSGYSMDDVKVHYNSEKPAQLQAHAYAQGTDIHVASGQEQHLPHEAWHVVQQKQGRVKPTAQLKGTVNINDDAVLEKEADMMGAKALAGNFEPVQQKPIANAYQSALTVQREKENNTSIPMGYTIELKGNFIELLADAYGAFQAYNSGQSTATERFTANTKATASGIATLVAGLKADEIETGTSCLESVSEGLNIFNACKEVGEAWGKVNFSADTYMETFENLGGVLLKLSDVIVGAMKSAEAFVDAMGWLTGKIKAFAAWAPLSDIIVKGVKFLTTIKQYYNTYISYKKLTVLFNNTNNAAKRVVTQYLVEEQWSRLKNGVVTVGAALSDFAADAVKYIPGLGINAAWAAIFGAASKALPPLHNAGQTVYDNVRQTWRNMISNHAPTSMQPSLAATDKADLDLFRDQIIEFVMQERLGNNADVILGSLGLREQVKNMANPEARTEIEKAVENIK